MNHKRSSVKFSGKIGFWNWVPEIQGILYPIFILVAFGILMVYSSSSIYSLRIFDDASRYLWRQIVFTAFGLGAMFLGAKIPFSNYRKHYLKLMIFTLILLALTLVPYFGTKIYGARRWIRLGPIGFQPVELLKLAILFWVSDFLERKQYVFFNYYHSILPAICVVGVYLTLLLLQPDFGNTVLIALTILFMVFLGGGRPIHLLITGILTGLIFVFLIFNVPYRMERIRSFLDPWADPNDGGYQLINSLISFAGGGITGRGIGNSLQKQFFLPQAHTDFIFAVIGEELGLVGVGILILLYLFLFLIGLKAVTKCKNNFGKYLGLGILIMFIMQVMIHMAVVVGLVPTKGIGLPLVSYGGSSLVVTMFMLGILYNIGLYSQSQKTTP